MKRTLISLIVVFLASITLSAQSRLSYSWEFVAGVGVEKGPQFSFTPEFIAQYDLVGGFKLGAGVGTRFARPCHQYITKNGSHQRSFCYELDVPVFIRLGYGKERIYANLDAGYAICAFSFHGAGRVGDTGKEPSYDGFFVEPQVGWKVGSRSALALGILFQQSIISNHVITETGTWNDPSYSLNQRVTTLNVFTPAITLRYVLGW